LESSKPVFDVDCVRKQLAAEKVKCVDAAGKVVAFKDELERVRAKLQRAEDDRDKNAAEVKSQADKMKTLTKDLADSKKQTAGKAGEAKREHAKVAGLQAQIKALEDQLAAPVDDEEIKDELKKTISSEFCLVNTKRTENTIAQQVC
jgi:septal ring factor EnvC (AmiA/AmiB activator)